MNPVAYKHTLDNTEGIPENEPWVCFSESPNNPFGVPGQDYSENFPWLCEPLYTEPKAAIAVAVPPSYALVPIEPTREMLNAAIDAHGDKLCEIGALGFRRSPQWMFEQSYAAMLAASPSAPIAEQVERDAARYRWLRDHSVPPHNFYLSVPVEFEGVKYAPCEVDAYIDAAMTSSTGEAK